MHVSVCVRACVCVCVCMWGEGGASSFSPAPAIPPDGHCGFLMDDFHLKAVIARARRASLCHRANHTDAVHTCRWRAALRGITQDPARPCSLCSHLLAKKDQHQPHMSHIQSHLCIALQPSQHRLHFMTMLDEKIIKIKKKTD